MQLERLEVRVVGMIFAGAMTASGAFAAQPRWFDEPYRYVVIDQDVRSVLSEFGRNVGVSVVLSDAVRGRIQGEVRGETAGRFLGDIADAGNLVWFFDGSILHVSAAAEQATQVVKTPGVAPGDVEREMRRLGLWDDRFEFRSSPGSGGVTVSGPPAYRAVVANVAEAIAPRAAISRDDPRVRVFRGGLPVETVESRSSAEAEPSKAARQ